MNTRHTGPSINDWKQFNRHVRDRKIPLLKRLSDFSDPILVGGCQRSGTTMISRIITNSEGMVNYYFSNRDELDAAQILCGSVEYKPNGRHCFQTTYLNDSYHEYFEHKGEYKLLWILRNPQSVVYSLLNNWRRFALTNLFEACGEKYLGSLQRNLYRIVGPIAVNRLQRACLAYNGKVSQTFELYEKLGKDQLLILDYDQIIASKEIFIPAIYKFINLNYRAEYSKSIHSSSRNKANKLSRYQARIIHDLCDPVYTKARSLISDFK